MISKEYFISSLKQRMVEETDSDKDYFYGNHSIWQDVIFAIYTEFEERVSKLEELPVED